MSDYRPGAEGDKQQDIANGLARRRPNSPRLVRWLFGALVSILCLWLALCGVDWSGTWQSIRQADLLLLALSLLTVIVTTLIRSARWRYMFYPQQQRIRLTNAFRILLIGQVANAVIPARIGEIARAYLLGEREGVSKGHALWTTVLEKVLDAFTLLAFVAILSLVVDLPSWLTNASWVLAGGIVVFFALLVIALWIEPATLQWLSRLELRWPWLQRLRMAHLFRRVAQSVHMVRSPRAMAGLAAWSLLAFLSGAGTNWLVARALGLPLSLQASLLLLAVLQISAVVPLPTSPGRVGLFHYLCIITLSIYGISREISLGYGLVLHVIVYLPMMVGGPLGIWAESLQWRDMVRRFARPDALQE